MAWLDPTDETDVGTAPDGRIYMDRERCRKMLVSSVGTRLSLYTFLFALSFLVSPLSALFFHTAAQTTSVLRVFAILLGAGLLLNLLAFLILFIKWLILFLRARKGIYQVETDEVCRVVCRRMWFTPVWAASHEFYRRRMHYSFWERKYITIISFRKKGRIILPGEVTVDSANTRDTFYIVRAGKSSRSHRIDLWFDTRKYVWKD